MDGPELILIAGCNAAGKSTFIRTRLNELESFEVIMTDVYKGRTKEVIKQAIVSRKNILIETVFNDSSFKDLIDLATNAGYQTSLIVLFLDNLQQSINRVAARIIQQGGIPITGGNIKINFNESFKNLANYFFYFNRSDFIYTGNGMINQLIMSFYKSELMIYNTSDLDFPQKFAGYSFNIHRLEEHYYKIISSNKNFRNKTISMFEPGTKFKL